MTASDATLPEDRPVAAGPGAVDYSLIFNAASNGMAFTEYDSGKIVDVNAAWIRATDVARHDAIGKSALDLGLWADLDQRQFCMDQLAATGHVVDAEVDLLLNRQICVDFMIAAVTSRRPHGRLRSSPISSVKRSA